MWRLVQGSRSEAESGHLATCHLLVAELAVSAWLEAGVSRHLHLCEIALTADKRLKAGANLVILQLILPFIQGCLIAHAKSISRGHLAELKGKAWLVGLVRDGPASDIVAGLVGCQVNSLGNA